MSDGPRIIYPFGPAGSPPTRDEITYNCSRWALTAKRELALQHLDRKLGFIFAFFQRGQVGQGVGVVAANVNDQAVKDELQAMIRRWGDQRRIVLPEKEY